MERYCSTGQSPQRAVAPTEEEGTSLRHLKYFSTIENLFQKKNPHQNYNVIAISNFIQHIHDDMSFT